MNRDFYNPEWSDREVYADMVRRHRGSASDVVVWQNLVWLTWCGIADYFRLPDCCETIVGASDPCPCSLPSDDEEPLSAFEAAEYDLMSSFAYWRMLPVSVQNFAICDWLNGTSVETPVYQNTDVARRFVIENACHIYGYADSEEATYGKRDIG